MKLQGAVPVAILFIGVGRVFENEFLRRSGDLYEIPGNVGRIEWSDRSMAAGCDHQDDKRAALSVFPKILHRRAFTFTYNHASDLQGGIVGND